jgi:iron(III) transport system substrate-binding protein
MFANGSARPRRRFVFALATAIALSVGFAAAQDDARLARAKAKGTISWYTSAFPTEMREELAQAFQNKTGIKVSIYAGGGGQVASRLRTERQTGAKNVDVLDGGDDDIINALVKDGIFKKFTPKGAEAINADFKDPNGFWYGIYFWALVLEYNTTVYKPDTAPQGFDALIDPRFKGKVVTADPARSTAGLGFVKAMVKWKGWEWVEKFVQNDPLVLSITSGMQPVLVKGERPIAIMTSQFAVKTIEEGGPVAVAKGDFLFGSPDVVGIISDAPNPDGAELFVEYLLSKEAQEIVRKHGPYSTRTDVGPPKGMPPVAELKFKYKVAPSLDNMDANQVAEKFNSMLQAKK